MPFLILLEDEKLCVCSWRIIEAHLGENKFLSHLSQTTVSHNWRNAVALCGHQFSICWSCSHSTTVFTDRKKKIIHANLRPESNKSFFFFWIQSHQLSWAFAQTTTMENTKSGGPAKLNYSPYLPISLLRSLHTSLNSQLIEVRVRVNSLQFNIH